jgi:hypothetical protein
LTIAELDFKINSELCFLISNLIQNAIRHNVKNGQIISIKDQALLISNTGSLEALKVN